MINELAIEQIVALSKQGAASGEIAAELGIPEEQVKLALRANRMGTNDDRDINDAQLALLRQRAYNLAFDDDSSVAAKMVMFLVERDKPKAQFAGGGANINLINQAIVMATGEFEKMKDSYK